MTKLKVIREERGWAGHFTCAVLCLFRRNTLLTCGNRHIVVSTVGAMRSLGGKGFEEIGYRRYYETMAFESVVADSRYHDADVSKEVYFNSPHSINKLDADDEANAMHEAVVAELSAHLADEGGW